MKSLTTFDYPAPIAEKASGASLVQQRNWMQRGYLRSPLPPPHAGKPRMFSLLGVYECAAYAHGSSVGIPVAVLSQAFKHRVTKSGQKILVHRARAQGRDTVAFWEADAWKAAAVFGNLREFLEPKDFCWVMAAHWPSQQDEPEIRAFDIAERADLDSAIATVAKTAEGVVTNFVILSISEVVRAVDAALGLDK